MKQKIFSCRWLALFAAVGLLLPGLQARTLIEAGSAPEAKVVSKEDPISTRFRREFDATALGKDERLVLGICAADGWVAYLNGNELARVDLPEGSLNAKTLALEPLPASRKGVFVRVPVPSEAIRRDLKNELEVEVHSASTRGSQLSVDLELKTLPPVEPPPSPSLEARRVLETYRFQHYVPPGTTIPDGYFDGGRNMTLDADDHAESPREILLVDRAHDPELAKDLDFARSLRDLPPLARTRKLFAFVGEAMSPPGGSDALEFTMAELASEFMDKALRIGDVQDQYHAGVCRHRSLLFKILADEAGLKAALVRGNYVHLHAGTGGAHAWNEVQLEDGRRFLVDTMRYPNSDLPEITSADVTNSDIPKRYVGVDGKHYYQSASTDAGIDANPPKLEPAPWADGEKLILKLTKDDGSDLGAEEFRAETAQNGAVWRFGKSLGMSGQNSVGGVESDAETLRPLSSFSKDVRFGETQAVYQSGAVELNRPGKKDAIKIKTDANAIDREEMIYELRRLPLEEGYQTVIPMFAIQGSGEVAGVPVGLDLELQVGQKEKIETQGGKWECYPVKTSTGETYWLSTDAHRYLVKFTEGRIVGALEAISVDRDFPPVTFLDRELGVSLTAPPHWLVCRYKAGQPANTALIRTFDPNAETEHGHLRLFTTKTLSKEEQKSSKSWVDSQLKKHPMNVRQDSWKEYTVAGRTGVGFLADDTENGKQLVMFCLYAVGPKVSEQFVYACAPEKFDALKQDIDGIIASYRIK